MNIYLDHIYLNTTIPSETLARIIEQKNNNIQGADIQKGYTEYLARFVRAYIYGLLYRERARVRVSFQIRSQFKSFDNLKQAVSEITPTTPNSISIYYPKTAKTKNTTSNPLPSPRLKFNLDTFILSLEKVMFSKYLSEYLQTLN